MHKKLEHIFKILIYNLLTKISDDFIYINNIDESTNTIFNIFLILNDDLIYKNLVYLNRFSKIGIFTLSYQYNLVINLNANNKIVSFYLKENKQDF